MSPHTPGRWYVSDEEGFDDLGHREVAVMSDLTGVSDFLHRGKAIPAVVVLAFQNMEGMQDANARLISAAPDLLVACKALVEVLDIAAMLDTLPARETPPGGPRGLALAAIAKAEGRA